jgi:hypothetical protein
MFVGEQDELASKIDARWIKKQLSPPRVHQKGSWDDDSWSGGRKSSLVHYEEIEDYGHLSFLISEDVTYFSERVMGLVQEHHASKFDLFRHAEATVDFSSSADDASTTY